MVQSVDQYDYIYRALVQYVESFDTYENFKLIKSRDIHVTYTWYWCQDCLILYSICGLTEKAVKLYAVIIGRKMLGKIGQKLATAGFCAMLLII